MQMILRNRRYGTNPVAVHFPGRLDEANAETAWWDELVEATAANPPTPQERRPSGLVTVLTWHGPNRPDKPNGLMERTCWAWGVPPVVLQAPAEPWLNLHKIQMTLAALAAVKTPYVMGLDSCDVVLLAHPDRLVQQWLRMSPRPRILANATGGDCWPPLPEFIAFEEKLANLQQFEGYKWLNSGAWVGYTSTVQAWYRDLAAYTRRAGAVPEYEYSDQAIWKTLWPNWCPTVDIDRWSNVFQWGREPDLTLHIGEPAIEPNTGRLLGH